MWWEAGRIVSVLQEELLKIVGHSCQVRCATVILQKASRYPAICLRSEPLLVETHELKSGGSTNATAQTAVNRPVMANLAKASTFSNRRTGLVKPQLRRWSGAV